MFLLNQKSIACILINMYEFIRGNTNFVNYWVYEWDRMTIKTKE